MNLVKTLRAQGQPGIILSPDQANSACVPEAGRPPRVAAGSSGHALKRIDSKYLRVD